MSHDMCFNYFRSLFCFFSWVGLVGLHFVDMLRKRRSESKANIAMSLAQSQSQCSSATMLNFKIPKF